MGIPTHRNWEANRELTGSDRQTSLELHRLGSLGHCNVRSVLGQGNESNTYLN